MARASEKTQRNTSILTIVNQMNAVCPHMGLHVRWCFQSEDQKKVRKTKVIDKKSFTQYRCRNWLQICEDVHCVTYAQTHIGTTTEWNGKQSSAELF